jgi:hypothetical protein
MKKLAPLVIAIALLTTSFAASAPNLTCGGFADDLLRPSVGPRRSPTDQPWRIHPGLELSERGGIRHGAHQINHGDYHVTHH